MRFSKRFFIAFYAGFLRLRFHLKKIARRLEEGKDGF